VAVSLDDGLRADLTAKKQPAVDTWKKAIDTVNFFEQHKEFRTYQPNGLVAVISNFAEPDFDAAEEAINLMPRVRQPFRLIARQHAASASFAGLQAIYYMDKQAPDAALRKKLLAFANDGALCWCRPIGPIRRVRRRRPRRTFCSACARWAKAAWGYARKRSRTPTIRWRISRTSSVTARTWCGSITRRRRISSM